MKQKTHETPEFQVIRQDEANAKFFVASGGVGFTSGLGSTSVNTYSTQSTSGWF